MGIGQSKSNVSGVSVEKENSGQLHLLVGAVGMIQQPGVNGDSVSAGDYMGFEGDVVFGRRAISAWIFRRATGHSVDAGEVQERILLVISAI